MQDDRRQFQSERTTQIGPRYFVAAIFRSHEGEQKGAPQKPKGTTHPNEGWKGASIRRRVGAFICGYSVAFGTPYRSALPADRSSPSLCSKATSSGSFLASQAVARLRCQTISRYRRFRRSRLSWSDCPP